MNLQLKDKTALVSGSSQGIGFAIAEALAAEGATVVINSYKLDLVDQAIDKLSKTVRDARLIGAVADLSTEEGVQDLVKKVPAVDILVNSVGFYVAKDFLEISDKDWDQMMNLNFMSSVRLSRAYLPGMKTRNWGRIIFISSESGVKIPHEMIHYGVSKAAQIAVARGIAETTTGTGVTVNSVLPGPTRSEGVEAFIQQMVTSRGVPAEQVVDEFFKTFRPTSIIKRFIRPQEVASLVTYLCSPLLPPLTGPRCASTAELWRQFPDA
jgi:NAD(P)-dependent dehydrogenase (short-subunit alcohol dehydrogenase family)